MAEATSSKPVDLKLTAVGSGRVVDLSSLSTAALLICFGQETQAGIDAVEAVARDRYPRASQLLVANVVDLHKIPGLMRKLAEGVLNGEHKKAVEALPAGAAPDDYVVVLPDWDGSAIKALGLEDATKAIGLALVAPGGAVLWRYQGPEPADAIRAHLEANPL